MGPVQFPRIYNYLVITALAQHNAQNNDNLSSRPINMIFDQNMIATRYQCHASLIIQ